MLSELPKSSMRFSLSSMGTSPWIKTCLTSTSASLRDRYRRVRLKKEKTTTLRYGRPAFSSPFQT